MTKLLLLSKDGTLITPKSGKPWVQSPWDQIARPGVEDSLIRYAIDGWTAIIISNQTDVAAGHKSFEDTVWEMQFCLDLLPYLREAFFCPDSEGRTCWRVWGACMDSQRMLYYPGEPITIGLGLAELYQTPNPGMLKLAMALHNADEVLMIGNSCNDEQAAQAAGIDFMWVEQWTSVSGERPCWKV